MKSVLLKGWKSPEGEFDSITEAAKSLGLTYKQYNYFKKRGRRVLSIDGKEYIDQERAYGRRRNNKVGIRSAV